MKGVPFDSLTLMHPASQRSPRLRSPVQLGGLYVRAAAAELLDDCCSLDRRVLMTMGCPHLGVRRYTYLPLPTPLPTFLQSASRVIAGQTAEELLLRDGAGGAQPHLLSMSMPDAAHGRALRAFRHRRLYANLEGDFMVPL